ncbi:MAG: hypothetical protein RIR88_749 [Actinomycetota bacterium]
MWVRWPGLVGAIAAPAISIFGQLIAMMTWPGYDPVAQTISELAAGDAPTQFWVELIFCGTGCGFLLTSLFTPAIAKPGRVLLFVGGLAFFGVAAFPLETMAASSSAGHKISAMIGFIALAAWPLVGMRRDARYPWALRPLASLAVTAVMAVCCFWFLGVWSNPELGYVGLTERLAAGLEAVWPLVVVLTLWGSPQREGASIGVRQL